MNLRSEIIEGYLRVVAREGVRKATLQRIAEEAEVSVGAIQNHFPSRKNRANLEDAAAAYVVEKGIAAVNEFLVKKRKLKSSNVIHAYFEGTFLWLQNKAVHTPFLLYFYHLNATHIEERQVLARDMWVTGRVRIEALIHEAVGRGTYPKVENAEKLSRQLHALLMGICLVGAAELENKTAWQRNLRLLIETADQVIRSAALH